MKVVWKVIGIGKKNSDVGNDEFHATAFSLVLVFFGLLITTF